MWVRVFDPDGPSKARLARPSVGRPGWYQRNVDRLYRIPIL